MNIEELTKSQIVLLTLFVSFVTSIATGIVTVSLVQQAPPAITQSVSRVIQETVQTVAPSSNSQHAAATVTEQKTIVVNDSDLVSKAVAQVTPSVVRLYVGPSGAQTFAGLGVVIDANGMVAADSDALGDSGDATLALADGTNVRAFVRARDTSTGIAYLLAATSSAPVPKWVPIAVADQHAVLGQSVIALAGNVISRIANGLVVSIVPGSASTSPQVIETNIAAGSLFPGSPLIDESGVLLGLSTAPARNIGGSDFLSVSALTKPLLK